MTLGARAVTGGLALALLLPAAAEAAVLAPLKPCYISPPDGTPESVALRGAGFTPGSSVDIAVDGVPVEQNVFVEADGSFGGNGGGVPAPRQASGERPFTVTVAERGNPANIVSASSQVVALGVQVSPSDVRPRRRVRFSGAGFTGAGPMFGHYARRGRLRRTVRLARPQGPCGTFSVRRRMIPVRRPALGLWTLQIDQARVYRREPMSAIWYTLDIEVFRRG